MPDCRPHESVKETDMTAAQLHRREGMMTAVEMIREKAEKFLDKHFRTIAGQETYYELLHLADEIERAIDTTIHVDNNLNQEAKDHD